MSGTLVVFAKRPEPGLVKTRLCPPFRPEQAAAFYAAMLDDVLEATARWAPALGLAPVLAVHPPEARAQLARRAPAPFRVVAQRGRDLSERMESAAAEAAAASGSPVLLRGSDSPTLAEDALRAALRTLSDGADLVLSPDRDGGYNLAGLARTAPGIFAHPMSTGTVLADTVARARARGLRVELLPPGFDIDTAEDLRLLAEARQREAALPCPRSLAYLDACALWPAQPPGFAPEEGSPVPRGDAVRPLAIGRKVT